ncbi:4Fe-4S dicluster domain-containing protein [Candidatus Riflebacteria bacterium]
MKIIEKIREQGVVGAGGAGFPAHVKFNNKAEVIIINAAECEPLLHKDKELLLHKTEVFLKGLEIATSLVGAARTLIGIKGKNKKIIQHLKKKCGGNIEIKAIRDFYPAGDEITLIFETTGRIVGAGQLPISQNIIVSNVETIYNLAQPGPVISKFLTIGGYVKKPATLEVPVGTPFGAVIDFAVPLSRNFGVIVGGPMMGQILDSHEEGVSKTTGGIIVLPENHVLLNKYRDIATEKTVRKIGKAACDQCTFCTELCPRYLLGHPIEPHKAMRTLIFSSNYPGLDQFALHTLFCCECNLCSFYSCPEDLLPSTVCILNKRKALNDGKKYAGRISNKAFHLADFRRIPVKKIMTKLDLLQFKNEGPLVDFPLKPEILKIALKQHVGAPARPVVSKGEQIEKGQKLATCSGSLGSEIHSPIRGKILEITDKEILVKKNS